MKKRYIVLVSIVVIALALVSTNPSQDEYVEWASSKVFAKEGLFTKVGVDELAKPVINTATEKQDMLLFTIYKTNIPAQEEPITTIGFFKQFITF